jgi:hypothetical protein
MRNKALESFRANFLTPRFCLVLGKFSCQAQTPKTLREILSIFTFLQEASQSTPRRLTTSQARLDTLHFKIPLSAILTHAELGTSTDNDFVALSGPLASLPPLLPSQSCGKELSRHLPKGAFAEHLWLDRASKTARNGEPGKIPRHRGQEWRSTDLIRCRVFGAWES